MPSEQTHLLVRRLYIVTGTTPVYDEIYHSGVNIIRGENSSGKSTIADFIYYALGGDFKSWKPEAGACDYVFLEILLNGAVVTLKRQVAKSSQQSMSIFWGSLDDSLKSNITGWMTCPFRRSSKKQSFSQILFEALEFPEVRNDADSNITMHQILRLLYVDQLSNVLSLLRNEAFDSPLTRETIGVLLFGVYDDSIYLSKHELRAAERKRDNVKEQIKHLISVLEVSDQEIDPSSLDHIISEKEEQLEKVYEAIKGFDSTKESAEDINKEIANDIEDARSQYLSKSNQLSNLRERLFELSLEVQDSRQFISTLQSRVRAFDESEIARESISELNIAYCPLCLSPIRNNDDKSICHLCKNTISPDVKKANLLRMKQELLFQIKESKSLLTSKEDDYAILEREVPQLLEEIKISKLSLEDKLSRIRTVRSNNIDKLFYKKGQLESAISFLHKQGKAIAVLEGLKRNQSELDVRISQLKISIERKEQKQWGRLETALIKIEEIAFNLLRADLPREETFQSPESILIDFNNNTFAVNERNDFSASSIVYLKNAIHFAIAFASLEIDFFRYPRFILCDNMEDKGMEEGRSHNFQRKIVALSQAASQPHQMIFTTSMIAPELDNSEFCVGEKYTQASKSLRFS